MSDVAIRVENISKLYRLGETAEKYNTLRDAIASAATAPFRALVGRSSGELNGKRAKAHEDDNLLWALKDVSFEVKRGEVLGIIGRNGAGKSTLLKVLSRITEPTTGKIDMYGRVASLLEVGTGFHPELTGRENIFLNGSILGMSRQEIKSKFDEIVDFAGVERFIDTPVKRYSSGMGVRLGFSVAAHLEPEILIIDEVLAVGDAEFQKKCLGKMQEVGRSGRTVLFVSHKMEAVNELCSRAIWIHQGGVRDDGEKDDVIERYLTSFSEANTRAVYVRDAEANEKPISLLCAEVRSSGGEQANRIKLKEKFSLHTEWKHNELTPGACYSIRIRDAHSRLIFATNTIGLSGITPNELGNFSVECTVDPNILTPGIYQVSIGAWVRPHGAIDDVEDCITFEVDPIAAADSEQFRASGNPAVIAPVRWINNRG